MKSRLFVMTVTGVSALMMAGIFVSCTSQSHHPHSDAEPHAHPTTQHVAHTYSEGIVHMRHLMTSMDTIVKSGNYRDVHNDAETLVKLSDSMSGLATLASSTVPRDRVRNVTETAKQLSATTESFHDAAHEKDLARMKADYAQMETLIATLEGYGR